MRRGCSLAFEASSGRPRFLRSWKTVFPLGAFWSALEAFPAVARQGGGMQRLQIQLTHTPAPPSPPGNCPLSLSTVGGGGGAPRHPCFHGALALRNRRLIWVFKACRYRKLGNHDKTQPADVFWNFRRSGRHGSHAITGFLENVSTLLGSGHHGKLAALPRVEKQDLPPPLPTNCPLH